MPIYTHLDLVITLRCNGACRNCIRLCNSTPVTGLDYSSLDMTESDVRFVIADVQRLAREIGAKPVVDEFCITGGEPTLHPELEAFWALCERELLRTGYVDHMVCNVNRSRPVPSAIEPHAVNFGTLAEKPSMHIALLLDGECNPPMTRERCSHFRKDFIIVDKHGYMRCCASEGYTRLFCDSALVLPRLPSSLNMWPNMDHICKHCAFGASPTVFERDAGAPLSAVFEREAERNRAGRKLRRAQ